MEIVKFKKIGNSKYNLYFSNGDYICVFENIIFKYNLLINKNIDDVLLSKIFEDNKYYDAYYLLIKYISIKLRNKKELVNYLINKEFDEKYIDFAIKKVEDEGLLNDKEYIKCYINDRINLSLDGPNKIRNYLVNNDFDVEYINDYLDNFSDEFWINRINKFIDKKNKTLKNKSYNYIINKFKNDLYILGYDYLYINNSLKNIIYDNSSINSEFIKAKKRYDDKNKIINYLLRKGYSYDEIINTINNN